MHDLNTIIESFDPGHFGRRKEILEDLSVKARRLGFFPLQISSSDVECFWLRLEANALYKNKRVRIERYDLESTDYVNLLKEVARYETR